MHLVLFLNYMNIFITIPSADAAQPTDIIVATVASNENIVYLLIKKIVSFLYE